MSTDPREMELARRGTVLWDNLLKSTPPEYSNRRKEYAATFAACSAAWFNARIRDRSTDPDDAIFQANLGGIQAFYGGKQISRDVQSLADKAATYLAALKMGLGGRGDELAMAAIQAGMNSTKEERDRTGSAQMNAETVLSFQVQKVGQEPTTLQAEISRILTQVL